MREPLQGGGAVRCFFISSKDTLFRQFDLSRASQPPYLSALPSLRHQKIIRRKQPRDLAALLRNNPAMDNSGIGPRLIIVCGLPGSGKTTHARLLEDRLQAVRFSPDEWMEALAINHYDEEKRAKIEALQWNLTQQFLALGLTVIIEWGTWGRSERDTLRLGARALGAAVELHYLSAPIDVLFDRLQRRGTETPPIRRDDLMRWSNAFQSPTPEEISLFDPPSF